MTLTDWIQAISMVILVVVTSIYVWRTHAISKATKEQADATKEQFLGEARPYLLLRLKDSAVQWNNIEPDKHYPKEFQIIIHNAGKGPAIRLYAAQWHQYKSHFVSENKGYLLSGKEWGTTIGRFTKLIDEKEG
ncbi:MAG: hypothetical protein KKF26_07575, partial [Chloroflexi bacterium]|nr:hypothetical protein [Chloroflexota bacterium]